jgi:hypothetical protein
MAVIQPGDPRYFKIEPPNFPRITAKGEVPVVPKVFEKAVEPKSEAKGGRSTKVVKVFHGVDHFGWDGLKDIIDKGMLMSPNTAAVKEGEKTFVDALFEDVARDMIRRMGPHALAMYGRGDSTIDIIKYAEEHKERLRENGSALTKEALSGENWPKYSELLKKMNFAEMDGTDFFRKYFVWVSKEESDAIHNFGSKIGYFELYVPEDTVGFQREQWGVVPVSIPLSQARRFVVADPYRKLEVEAYFKARGFGHIKVEALKT